MPPVMRIPRGWGVHRWPVRTRVSALILAAPLDDDTLIRAVSCHSMATVSNIWTPAWKDRRGPERPPNTMILEERKKERENERKKERKNEMYHVRVCGRLAVVEGRKGDYVAGRLCGWRAISG